MLNKAKALFSRKAAVPSAEPFSIRCLCGRKVEGLRRSEAQTATCHHCNGPVFVLPICQLPPPGPMKKAKSAPGARSAPIAPVVESVPDELLDVNVPLPNEDVWRERKRPAILDRKWMEDDAEEEAARRRKTLLSKRQAIALGVVLLVAAGGYGMYVRTVARELADNLPDRARRGFQLLQEGKIEEAYEPLRLAWRAIDWAGAQHEQSEAIHQAFLEVSAVRDLVTEPLDAALESAVAEPASFGARFKGRALLLDLEIEKNPEGGWLLHWALPVGEQVVRLHSQGVDLFADLQVDKPTRALVAARIEGLERTEEGLFLRIEPTSGVFVTEFALLQKMGLESDAAAEAVRRAQRQRVAP